MKKIIFTVVLSLIGISAIKAQGVEVSAGADLVSSYIWRGIDCSPAAFQPSLGVSYKGLSLTAWGSTDFNSLAKEFDFILGYTTGNLSVSLTDYAFPFSDVSIDVYDQTGAQIGRETFSYDYFDYDQHQLEVGIFYTISEKVPLSLAWNTFISGNDKKPDDPDSQNFSSYFEVGYSLAVNGLAFDFAVGGSPWESGVYGNDSFAITNLSIKGSKEIKITDSFSLPVFSQVIVNPELKNAHFVFGLSF